MVLHLVVVGVERLAGMSLQNPVRVDITQGTSKSKSPSPQPKHTKSTPQSAPAGDTGCGEFGDSVAMPENLQHHYMVVPQKLRLVTLAAFLLWKCKVTMVGEEDIL